MSTTAGVGIIYKGYNGETRRAVNEAMLYNELREYVKKYRKLDHEAKEQLPQISPSEAKIVQEIFRCFIDGTFNDYTGGSIEDYFQNKNIDIGKGYNIKSICRNAARWLNQFADGDTNTYEELEKMKLYISSLQCRLGIGV